MRVMVVSATRAATRKKMNGNTCAMESTRFASDSKLATPWFWSRSMTSHDGFSKSSIFCCASAI